MAKNNVPKKTSAKSRSKKLSNKRSGLLRKAGLWASSHRFLVILVALVMFSSLGAYLIIQSRANTYNLTFEECFIRGRKGDTVIRTNTYTGERYYDYNCLSGVENCRDGAGKWIKPTNAYGYCSNAISTSIGKSKCENELRRQYVGTVGCARWWRQTENKDAMQCLVNSRTYHVANPYDYCGSAPASSTGGAWVWPVSPNTGVGGFGSGHYARDFDGVKGTTIRAVSDGDIVWKGQISSACGNGLILKTTKPGGGETFAVYEHMTFSSASGRVSQGTTLGWMTAPPNPSGGCWYGYHLHLGIQTHGRYVESHRSTYHQDPCAFLSGC